MDIVARWPGSTHDATIFNNSRLKVRFESGHFENCMLLGNAGVTIEFLSYIIIVGDSAYNTRPYLLTPMLNPTTAAENLYNSAHIRTRNVIERLFGVWKRRFPILAYGCRLKINNLLIVIVATAVLHNIAQIAREEEPPLDNDINHLLLDGDIPVLYEVGAANNGFTIRRTLIDEYFATLV